MHLVALFQIRMESKFLSLRNPIPTPESDPGWLIGCDNVKKDILEAIKHAESTVHYNKIGETWETKEALGEDDIMSEERNESEEETFSEFKD